MRSQPPALACIGPVALARVLRMAEMRRFYGNFGFEAGGLETADFARQMRTDFARRSRFIKAIGYKSEP